MNKNKNIILISFLIALFLVPIAAFSAGEEEQNNREFKWGEPEPLAGGRGKEISEKQIERFMGRLSENNPEKAKELKRLKQDDPEKFKGRIRELIRERFSSRRRMPNGDRRSKGFRQETNRPCIGQSGKRGIEGRGDGHGMEGPRGGRQETGMRMHQRHEEYIEWLKKNYPQEAEKLAKLKEEKPELYLRHIMLSVKKYGKIYEESKDNPEVLEILKKNLQLKEQRDKLLRKIQSADDEKKKAQLVNELKQIVSQRFDLIVQRKQMAYEKLRQRLEKLKDKVKQSETEVGKWKEAKDEKVQERLKELISQTEKFNWD